MRDVSLDEEKRLKTRQSFNFTEHVSQKDLGELGRAMRTERWYQTGLRLAWHRGSCHDRDGNGHFRGAFRLAILCKDHVDTMAEKPIHFISLGCAKNRVDTEVMLGVSEGEGYRFTDDPAEAEVIVVNTCGFIGPAKEESINTILEMGQLKEEGSCKKLVVTGCLSQRYPEELAKELPEVDHFLGSSDMLKLGPVLREQSARMLVGNPADWVIGATDPRRLSGHVHSAFIKIAEGCNRTCSFCAIPAIRGKQRSRPLQDIVSEVRTLSERGLREANLVSQDTIAYGRDLSPKASLSSLLDALTEIDALEWIRVHYLYPEKLDDRLVELLRDHPKVLPYIDMPLQHVADAQLMSMRRGHGGERIYRVVERLRNALPELVFRTTFIVGHPSETEEDFAALTEFVQWAQFDHVGVFTYSHEEGTRSGEMTDLVEEKVAQARQAQLMELQRDISRKRLRARIGREECVLVSGPSEEMPLLSEGRWWGQAPEVDGRVFIANGEPPPGSMARVLIREAGDYDLVGDFVDAHGMVDLPPGVEPVRRLPLY